MSKEEKRTDKKPLSKAVHELLERFKAESFKIEAPEKILDRPIDGTTLYLATSKVTMLHGEFTAYIFQDIIHKGYIIALAYGDIFKNKELYSRVHSSCITSETLRGCDCDCSEQLNGALEEIVRQGAGMFFYLMQEGRGVGYIAKARDRMLVQAANDEISTFEAYKTLGLKKDYRQYRNIKPICNMLGIDPEFVLLTNNPDKVNGLRELGINVVRAQPIEYEPSPYNLAYLTSKMESGHILERPNESSLARVEPPEQVIPFKPYALKNAQRFILTASYYLPIRPIDGEIVLTEEQFKEYFKERSVDSLIGQKDPLIKAHEELRKGRHKVTIHEENLNKFKESHPEDPLCNLLHLPYWFRVYVYFDIVTDEDFVVLTYGNVDKDDVPVVRLQSESLFNRFPLKDADSREKYEGTIREILNYGVGVIMHLYSDGRGAGLGAYAQDRMFNEAGLTANTMESYTRLGVSYDLRDYEAAMILMQEHLLDNTVQMIMNSPSSLVNKTEYTAALNELNVDVANWIFLEDKS